MKFIIFALSILIAGCANADLKTSKEQTCIFNNGVCLKNDNGSKILFIEGISYPSVSYYDDVNIKSLGKKRIQIINSYIDKSPITIYSDFYLKNNNLYLSSIKTISYPNISPNGAKQECNVVINSIFNKPLENYIDSKIFDLSESDKAKICTTIKNKK